MRSKRFNCLVLLGPLIIGCTSNSERLCTEDCNRYIDWCRETALTPVDKDDVDWMVYPCSMTTQEFKKDFRIVYADERYLSFRCEEFAYLGGAHGNNTITLGTIDRKTGRILKVNDVFPKSEQGKILQELKSKARQKLGDEEFQSEPTLIENFCLMNDGWHFVYNEYEIACYAAGAVEVIIERM